MESSITDLLSLLTSDLVLDSFKTKSYFMKTFSRFCLRRKRKMLKS